MLFPLRLSLRLLPLASTHCLPQVATTSATLDDATSMRIRVAFLSCIFSIFGAKIQKQSTKRSRRPRRTALLWLPPSSTLPQPWLLMPFSICFLFSIDVVVSCPFLFHVVAVVAAAACRQTIKMMRCIARCCCCCCPHPPIQPPSRRPASHHTCHAACSRSDLIALALSPSSDICYGQQAVRICFNLQHFVPWFCGTMLLPPSSCPALHRTRPPKSPIYIDENDVQLQFVGFCCIFQGKKGKNCQAAETAKWGKSAGGCCELAAVGGVGSGKESG